MAQEFNMTDKDAKKLLELDTAVRQASAYCQRCSVDIDRHNNSLNCRKELEMLAELGACMDASPEELIDTCKNCDYKAAYVADALNFK